MLRDLWLVLTGRISSEQYYAWRREVVDLHQIINTRFQSLEGEIWKLRNELVATFNDEMSPKRQQMSQELGKKMQRKLIAEDKARRHTLGEM